MKFTNAELTARMIFDQKNGWPFCPRCGKPLKIDPQTQRAASSNALSREVSGLYICDDCGSDEALRAFAGLPLPLEEWEQTSLKRFVLVRLFFTICSVLLNFQSKKISRDVDMLDA